MKGIKSLNILECPACGSQDIHLTCTRIKGDDIRVRYKRCKACNQTFVTEQKLTKEIVVPTITLDRRRYIQRANDTSVKLTVQDVMEIKYFLSKRSFTCKDLALQYEVTKGTIWSIQRGSSWKDVPTPSEYP